MKSTLILAVLVLFSMASPARAAAEKTPAVPVFGLPLACTPGVDCWVMNYLDMGPADDGKATDPFCGTRTYDGNKGTGFALADKKALQKIVPVLAAREGTVERLRDGEPDRGAPTDVQLKEIKDAQKECGNAILLDHGDGVQTIYCHIKNGSFKVKVGDRVKEGDVIAAVGMSGYTKFPQLHFGISWNGAVVDPFTGLPSTENCGSAKHPLWKDPAKIPYEPVALYAAGFSTQSPSFDMIDNGDGASPGSLSVTSPLLSFWTAIFGVQDGDLIVLEITAPDGTSFSRRVVEQKGTHTRQLYYTGRQLGQGTWMPGLYKGRATLTRTDKKSEKKDWTIERDISVQE